MHELPRSLPEDSFVVADTGHAGIWTGAWMDLRPRQAYLAPPRNLDWAVPAGISAASGARGGLSSSSLETGVCGGITSVNSRLPFAGRCPW